MSSPFSRLINKLAGGTSVIIQVIGDSTAWGLYDTGYDASGSQSPMTPPTLRGWPGRLGILLGQAFNATVNAWTWNWNLSTAYFDPVTLYTGSGAATITVYDGGWPGGTITNYLANIAGMLPVSDPDIIIIYDGYNEISYGVSSATYASNYATLVSEMQSTYCPGAPIIVTTQNGTPNAYDQPYYDVMIHEFLPAVNMPLSPAMQQSTVNTGVWVLDTQQAPLLSTDIAAAPHPDASGYTKIAQWIYDQLAASVSLAVGQYSFRGAATGVYPRQGGASGSFRWTAHPSASPVTRSSTVPWLAPFEITIGGGVGGTYGWASLPRGTIRTFGTARGTLGWSAAQNPGGTLPWTPPTALGAPSGTTGRKQTRGTASCRFAWKSYPPTSGGNNLTGSALGWELPVTLGTPPPDFSRSVGVLGWSGAAVGSRRPKAASTAKYGWTPAASSVTAHLGGGMGVYAWITTAQGYWTGRAASTYGWIALGVGAHISSGATVGHYGWATIRPTPGIMALSDAAAAIMVLADAPTATAALADIPAATMVLENSV